MAAWICCAEAEDLTWLEFLGASRDTATTHQSHENLLQKFPLCHSGGPLRADRAKGCHRTASINSNQMTGSKSKRLKCHNLSISEGLSGFEWQPRDHSISYRDGREAAVALWGLIRWTVDKDITQLIAKEIKSGQADRGSYPSKGSNPFRVLFQT